MEGSGKGRKEWGGGSRERDQREEGKKRWEKKWMVNPLYWKVVCILVIISSDTELGVVPSSYQLSLSVLYSQVVDLVEVMHVASIDLLRSLNLRGNPLRELPDYRLSVIFAVQQLTELDTQHVDIAEKVWLLTMGWFL